MVRKGWALRHVLLLSLVALPSAASARSEVIVASDTPDGSLIAAIVGQDFASCRSALGADGAFVLDETDGSTWFVDHVNRRAALISDRSVREWGKQRSEITDKQKQLKPDFDKDPHISADFKARFEEFYGKPTKPLPPSEVTWPTTPTPSAQPVPELQRLVQSLDARRKFIRNTFTNDPRMAAAFSCYFTPTPVPFIARPKRPSDPDLTFTTRAAPAPHPDWRLYQHVSLWQIFAQHESHAMFMGQAR